MRKLLTSTLITLIGLAAVCGARPNSTPTLPAFFFRSEDGAILGKAAGLNARFNATAVDLITQRGSLRIRFLNANPATKPETVDALGGVLNYITADPEHAPEAQLKMCRRVLYRFLYPGVDMYFGADGRLLKSEYDVSPGADLSLIKLHYDGSSRISLEQDGSLRVLTPGGTLTEAAPVAYQLTRLGRREIQAKYVIDEAGAITFKVADYDHSLPLVIDPTISFSTYLGGNGADVITSMAIDSAGSVYVAGYTDSPDFPVNGALQTRGGSVDAFVVKMSSTGDRILYATYVGGIGDDRAFGIAVDGNNRAIVVGSTTSSNFPVLNASQRTNAGGKDAFVLMLNASGSTLAFSTFFGGAGSDSANGVALDTAGNIYICGDTTSTNLRVLSPYQSTNKGRQDAMIAKFTSTGALVYSTYLGGAGDDKANGIAVDSQGAAYIAGETSSPDLPAGTGFQKSNGGGQDAFVAKISATGSAIVYASYLGGSGGLSGQPESASGVAVDASGNAVVVGVTSSANFPTVAAYQPVFGGGGTDAFVSKITADGTALIFSTFLGGIGGDSAKSVAIEAAGTILVAGTTFSANFPTLNGTQASKNGQTDAFLTRFTSVGTDVFFSTYIGGSGLDSANVVATSPTGDVWIAGQTTSTNFPLTNPLQSFGTPEGNGFIMQLGIQNLPPAMTSVTPANGNGMQQTFQFVASDPNGGADIKQIIVVINNQFSTVNACYFLWTQGTNAIYLASDNNSAWSPVSFGSATVVSNSACSITGTAISAVVSRNSLTLTVPITFQDAFSGGKGVWATTIDRGGLSTTWAQKGSWGVFPGTLIAPTVSITPTFGSGMTQTFQFMSSDGNGVADVKSTVIVINGALDVRNACYLLYSEGSNAVYLASDDTSTWTPVTLGSSGKVGNTQCTVSGSGSSVLNSGTTSTLTLSISFSAAFAGGKGIWMIDTDQEGLSSGWVQVGRWGVFTGPAVAPTEMLTPPNGTGNRQMFQFTTSDANGVGDIKQMLFAMNSSFSLQNACYLVFTPGTNQIYLASDDTQTWVGVQMGTSQTAQNSSCALSGTGASVSTTSSSVTLTIPLSFPASFDGQKYVWAMSTDYEGLTSGWQKLAVFTVQ